jgi:hypothetical protein
LKLILKEHLVHFKSPGSEKVYLEFNDKNLSADYFSFLTDPDFQDSLLIPMTFHPLFYHKKFWNKPIKIGRRKRSIFMAGNFNEKTYSAIENIPFKVKSRTEIYNFLLKNQLLSFYSSKSEFLNFLKGNCDNKCILSELPRGKPTRHPAEESFLFDENPSVFKLSSKIEASLGELNPKEIKRDNFSIPIEDLLNTLGSFNFYFACPGVIIPFSHNIIEAMSAGSIPLIQHAYAEMLQPPLVNNKNAIVYKDFDDLQKKIEYCYNLPEDLLNEMNSNVLKYYNEHLTPQAVIQKIQKGNYKKFYLQAEFESAKLFRYELLRKNLK